MLERLAAYGSTGSFLNFGLFENDLNGRVGLHTGLYSHGLYSYGLYSYGLSIVMAYIVMAYIVMAYILTAYILMARTRKSVNATVVFLQSAANQTRACMRARVRECVSERVCMSVCVSMCMCARASEDGAPGVRPDAFRPYEVERRT